jgi:hypothetical protein
VDEASDTLLPRGLCQQTRPLDVDEVVEPRPPAVGDSGEMEHRVRSENGTRERGGIVQFTQDHLVRIGDGSVVHEASNAPASVVESWKETLPDAARTPCQKE